MYGRDRLPQGFAQFLVTAKQATYAGQDDDASVVPLLPDSKQLEHTESNFLYRDIYVGMSRFVGQEIVYFLRRAIWSMSYSGGLCQGVEQAALRPVYSFLRKALTAVPENLPLRGPPLFEQGEMRYSLECSGSIELFHGVEEIRRCHELQYRLHFSGGCIS